MSENTGGGDSGANSYDGAVAATAAVDIAGNNRKSAANSGNSSKCTANDGGGPAAISPPLGESSRARSDRFLEETEGMPRRLRRSDTCTEMFNPFTKVVHRRDDANVDFESSFFQVPHLRDYSASVGKFPSPLQTASAERSLGRSFVSDNETILVDIVSNSRDETVSREFLRAGPRLQTAFHPKAVRAAIVTCGGLCPGINTVIRELYMTLTALYGAEEVYGVPMGYRGFYAPDAKLVRLNNELVRTIHHTGGSFLGSSRGGFERDTIVSAIGSYGINQVYVIGGDGTHRGANEIFDECMRRRMVVAVVGVPKTIDNDIAIVDHSFGFATAVEESQRAINAALVEARSGHRGIGLVRLMGRHSGYISMYATLASRDVDICLIPEVDFEMGGTHGLLQHISARLRDKGHCVIVVAEGAGMSLLRALQNKTGGGAAGKASTSAPEQESDASGNVRLANVGIWLKDEINAWFKQQQQEVNLKYIDPSYEIRSVPPVASDAIMCSLLAQSAVHGAMHGYTGFTVGVVNTHHVLIPIREIVRKGRTKIDVKSRMWHRVLAATLQPDFVNPE